MILVDTTAWIRHVRATDARLVRFLREGRVRTCDVVIGELLLGSGLPKSFARDMLALPRLPSPKPADTRAFIQRHHRSFGGSGVGWADAQIIQAAWNAGARVHTSDRGVRTVCAEIGVALAP